MSMLRMIAVLAALPALMAPIAVSAEEAAATQPAVKEKKVCKAEPITGSRLPPKRTCKTEAEWDALNRARESANRSSLDRIEHGRQ